jgi:hypothetical protein
MTSNYNINLQYEVKALLNIEINGETDMDENLWKTLFRKKYPRERKIKDATWRDMVSFYDMIYFHYKEFLLSGRTLITTELYEMPTQLCISENELSITFDYGTYSSIHDIKHNPLLYNIKDICGYMMMDSSFISVNELQEQPPFKVLLFVIKNANNTRKIKCKFYQIKNVSDKDAKEFMKDSLLCRLKINLF